MRSRVIKSVFGIYHYIISPALHTLSGSLQACRFTPSCSDYGREALLKLGLIQGSWLTIKRIMRCNPLCEGGFDPLPSSNCHFDPNLRNQEQNDPLYIRPLDTGQD